MSSRALFTAAAVTLAGVLLASAGAEAKTYTSKDGHFTITVPSSWEQSKYEAMWASNSPADDLIIQVVTTPNKDARNDASWLLAKLRPDCEKAAAYAGATYITRAHTYTNKAGRVGAECVLQLNSYDLSLKVRVVLFASEHYKETYGVSAAGDPDSYARNSGAVSTAFDSFKVEGEPMSLALLVGIIAVPSVGLGFYGYRRYRRGRRNDAARDRIEAIRQSRGYQARNYRPKVAGPPQPYTPAGYAPAHAAWSAPPAWGPGPHGYAQDPVYDPCPDCGQPLPFGAPRCQTCGLEFDWA